MGAQKAVTPHGPDLLSGMSEKIPAPEKDQGLQHASSLQTLGFCLPHRFPRETKLQKRKVAAISGAVLLGPLGAVGVPLGPWLMDSYPCLRLPGKIVPSAADW